MTNNTSMPSRMSLSDPAFARNLLLGVESVEGFGEFRDAYFRRYSPADIVEQDYLEEIVMCRWRLRRNWLAESGCCSVQVVAAKTKLEPTGASPFEVFLLGMTEFSKTKLPQQFRRQENSLTRQARDAEKRLAQLQAERKAAEERERQAEAERQRQAAAESQREACEKARNAEKPQNQEWKNEPPVPQLLPIQPSTPPAALPPGKAA